MSSLLLILLALTAAPLPDDPPLFIAPQHPVEGWSVSIAAGDLDGDGDVDLVTANQDANRVYVLAGDGEGGFLPAAALESPGKPVSVRLATLDDDALLDLAVVLADSQRVAVRFGDGAGGFASGVNVPTNGISTDVAAGDFDEDGDLDLVSADGGIGLVTVMTNDGIGHFTAAPLDADTASERIELLDVTGDGHLDLLIGGQNAKGITRMTGNGSGGFSPPRHFGLGPARSMAVGDLDGDGDLDVAHGPDAGGTAYLAYNDGTGSFPTTADFPLVGAAFEMALADLDGDGHLDLVATDYFGDGLRVWRGNGLGQIFPPHFTHTGENNWGLGLADFDSDGVPDVALGTLGAVVALRGDGAAGWQVPPRVAVGDFPRDVVAADMDADGALDLLTADTGAERLTLLLGAGDGTFSTAATPAVAGGPVRVATGDLDGDGALDAVAACQASGQVAILRGDGAGGLLPPSFLTVGPLLTGVAVGDVTGSDAPDLLVSSGLGPLQPGALTVCTGDGNGGFAVTAVVESGRTFWAVALGELQSGGGLDACALVEDGGPQTLYRVASYLSPLALAGQGLVGPSAFSTGPWDVVLGDLDGDAQLDAAVGRPDALVWLPGLGDGGFLSGVILPTRKAPRALAVADLDGDGHPDLVAASADEDGVVLHRGDGAGAFLPWQSWLAGDRPYGLAIGDFDGDGMLDAATANQFSSDVTILINQRDVQLVLLDLQPTAGNLTGGTTLTLTGLGFTSVGDTSVTVGGTPAEVLAVERGAAAVLSPAVLEPGGAALDVSLANSNGVATLRAAFTHTPALAASITGSAAAGGTLVLDWTVEPSATQVWLWLGHPLTPEVSFAPPAYAGVFHVPIFLLLLGGWPAGSHPLQLAFGPLDPAASGLPLRVQALVAGEGGPKGSFSNVAGFAIP